MGQLTVLPQAVVLWGEGVAPDAARRLADWGVERPIIFTAEALAMIGRERLGPHVKDRVGMISDLPAHVPDGAVRRALEACLECGARSIVAYGGGSVLDAAKAVSYRHHGRTGRFLPIAAFPTTLSGSEFSHYFGITESDGPLKFKRSYAVTGTVPAVVALDPSLLIDTPRFLLLSSAIKGIDHAVEGMRHVTVEHPHAIMAADGVRRFFSILTKWPKQLETRQAVEAGEIGMQDLLQLQLAAWHCYFSPASVIYGLSHRIGHVLGGTFGLPHSATSCITLAPVIRACADFYEGRLAVFAAGAAANEAGVALADRIAGLVTGLDLPHRIGDFGLGRDVVPQVSSLLKANYPNEVVDLGADAERKLERLLESLW
ncbi:MAG TPA: iron-containing alcohol dehydrogenase [Aliidongia sp.]|nr:iron-containing alcohol dehydrogenase [Aliidongia sp.]